MTKDITKIDMAKIMVTVYFKLDHIATSEDKKAWAYAKSIVKNMPKENMLMEYNGCIDKLISLGVKL